MVSFVQFISGELDANIKKIKERVVQNIYLCKNNEYKHFCLFTCPIQTHVSHPFDAHSSSCKADKDGVGCTCSTSRSQIVEDEDEKDEKSKHLEPAVEEKAAQASGGSRDLTETELSKKYLPELKEIAKNLDVKFPSKINKGELIQSILKKQAGK